VVKEKITKLPENFDEFLRESLEISLGKTNLSEQE
jgi:hypothetical protein